VPFLFVFFSSSSLVVAMSGGDVYSLAASLVVNLSFPVLNTSLFQFSFLVNQRDLVRSELSTHKFNYKLLVCFLILGH